MGVARNCVSRSVMTNQWFCEIMGVVVGPLRPSELLDKVRSGEVVPDTPVRKDDSQWVPAMEVNGLFEAAAKAIANLRCPYCGAKVGKPPTTCDGCERYLTRVRTVFEKPGLLSNFAAPAANADDDDDLGPARRPFRELRSAWQKFWQRG
jgi:hypothetical protein